MEGKDVSPILHLAASTSAKSFPDAFLNSVVTTRNLLDPSLYHARVTQFVLVTPFSVYANGQNPRWRPLDSCSRCRDLRRQIWPVPAHRKRMN